MRRIGRYREQFQAVLGANRDLAAGHRFQIGWFAASTDAAAALNAATAHSA